MASVWAPLPNVSDSARNSAITAISNAIFLFSLEACSACSACSMLSCALMILSGLIASRLTERSHLRKRQADMAGECVGGGEVVFVEGGSRGADNNRAQHRRHPRS